MPVVKLMSVAAACRDFDNRADSYFKSWKSMITYRNALTAAGPKMPGAGAIFEDCFEITMQKSRYRGNGVGYYSSSLSGE